MPATAPGCASLARCTASLDSEAYGVLLFGRLRGNNRTKCRRARHCASQDRNTAENAKSIVPI